MLVTALGVLATACTVGAVGADQVAEAAVIASSVGDVEARVRAVMLGGRLGAGCPAGGRGGGDGMETRGPQSMQSVPKANVANLELGPPLPPALRQLFVCTMPF